ncbi:MAG TPA: YceI family protein [Bacteroidales bacterium]|jgi:polyisoprenoid-binding protein YceI|nr:YceI family protein [Bacteroidales bacterium]HNQ82193.1 YceI family protein [Bacteroidales bacterium]HOX77061.1 YceI family protein [Bacteroidales bacterium]HPI84847.1 YceI family protein [Bacteroidales bacterium]HPM91161.1 YceI family protein [Bacteroidales bacterium]
MKKSLKILVIAAIAITASFTVQAQKYMTKNGNIKFYSETPIETIEATNNQVNAALDSQTGDLVFKVLIKSFQFEKALMQEHFNENYMESDKFPNSTFVGKVTNLTAVDFSKEGSYEATIEGDLTIHGVTKKISEKGTFTVKAGDKIHGISKFNVKPADYSIKIPGAVVKNIAETIEVTVDIELSKM